MPTAVGEILDKSQVKRRICTWKGGHFHQSYSSSHSMQANLEVG